MQKLGYMYITFKNEGMFVDERKKKKSTHHAHMYETWYKSVQSLASSPTTTQLANQFMGTNVENTHTSFIKASDRICILHQPNCEV